LICNADLLGLPLPILNSHAYPLGGFPWPTAGQADIFTYVDMAIYMSDVRYALTYICI